MSQIKLTTFELFQARNIENLRGQNEIKSFTVSGVDQSMVDIICNEFMSLEYLFISSINDFVDLSALSNLKNLKTFHGGPDVASLKTLQSKSLQKLSVELERVNVQELSSRLAVHCPNLCWLTIDTGTNLNIGLILLHFPLLERLQVDALEVIFPGELDQHELKHLQVRGTRMTWCRCRLKCRSIQTR
jgi:hypothetical protein